MIATNKTIPLLILFFLLGMTNIQGQKKKDSLFHGWGRISYQKEKIYLNFSKSKEKCEHTDIINKLKMKKKKGIQFNLCGEAVLLYKKNELADTLNIKNIRKYDFSVVSDIKKKIEKFRYKTHRKLPLKPNSKLYQAYDNNDLFETFLIEVINDKQFVIYPVIWRNQRLIR